MLKFLRILLLMIVPVSSFFLVSHLTHYGFTITPDSVYYLEGAKNIRKGLGFVCLSPEGFVPITHWPPLYSVALAIFGKFTNYIFHFMIVFISGLFIYILKGDMFWALVSQIIVATHTITLSRSAFYLSEVMFNAFVLLLMLFMLLYELRRKRIYATFMFIVAFILPWIRYMGLFVVPAFALFGIFFRRITYLIIASSPILGYIALKLYHKLVGGIHNVPLGFHPPTDWHWNAFRNTLERLIVFPKEKLVYLLFIIALVSLTILACKHRKSLEGVSARMFSAMLILGITFVAMLIVSITFVYVSTPLNERTLSTTALLFTLALLLFLSLYPKRFALIPIGLWFVANIEGYEHMHSWFKRPIGYNHPLYENMETLEYIKKLPKDAPIYTNAYDVILYRLKRPAYRLDSIQALKKKFSKHEKVYVIYLGTHMWRNYFPSPEDIARSFKVDSVINFRDGKVMIITP